MPKTPAPPPILLSALDDIEDALERDVVALETIQQLYSQVSGIHPDDPKNKPYKDKGDQIARILILYARKKDWPKNDKQSVFYVTDQALKWAQSDETRKLCYKTLCTLHYDLEHFAVAQNYAQLAESLFNSQPPGASDANNMHTSLMNDTTTNETKSETRGATI